MKKIDLANIKKLRFLSIVFLREKETIGLMFRCYRFSSAIKINRNWQMTLKSKKICIIDSIALLATLYQVKNFKLCDKHTRMLVKKVGLMIKNISAKILGSRLEKIWKNQELVKLEKLVSEKDD